MEALVLNKNLIAIGIIDSFESFIWVDRYTQCGDFELSVAADAEIFNILKIDNYLLIEESEHLMIIEGLSLTTDIEDGNKILVSGRSLESILDRRIIWDQTIIEGNLQDAIERLLNENIINPEIPERKIPNFRFIPSTDTAIVHLNVEAQFIGDSLYDAIVKMCELENIGWRITLSDDNHFDFQLYFGKDHSFAQFENDYIIFSPTFDNFLDSNYVISKKEQKTVALVSGEKDSNQEKKYVSVNAHTGGGSSLFRRETFIDAGNISAKTQTGGSITEEEYIAQLSQKGKEHLLENMEVVSFEGNADIKTLYGKEFFMGDIVQLVNEYGIELSARIVELIRSSDENGEINYPTFENVSVFDNTKPQIVVTGPISGATVIATSKSLVVLGVEDEEGRWIIDIPNYGEWAVIATLGSETESTLITVTAAKQYEIVLLFLRTYGVLWNSASPATTLSRTDDASEFSLPNPSVNNVLGNSPFDKVYPWSGMVKEIRGNNVMVKIPKFWFRWTNIESNLQLQIANKYTPGFYVSPAHADRNDGKGERDFVYVGRYHCNSSYSSTTGGLPITGITRGAARNSIHETNDKIWQMDLAMLCTIQMLYLVEFANWNSQAVIGYDCGNNISVQSMGYTDIMPYHTGTVLLNKTTYGLGIQYRWIEGLWGNVFDWVDGCFFNQNGIHLINSPNAFSDETGGTLIGLPTNGYPKSLAISSIPGFEWLYYPNAIGGNENSYIPDYWGFDGNKPCLYSGGSYITGQSYGLFHINCSALPEANIGCRIMELP